MIPSEQQNSEKIRVVLFQSVDLNLAVLVSEVEDIIFRPELSCLPNMPSALEGFVNLHQELIPVIDIAQLFGKSAREPQIYQHIVIIRGKKKSAFLTDRVSRIFNVPSEDVLSIEKNLNLKNLVQSDIMVEGETYHLLDTSFILGKIDLNG